MEVSKESLQDALVEMQKDNGRVKEVVKVAGNRKKALSYLRFLCLAFGLEIPRELISILRG